MQFLLYLRTPPCLGNSPESTVASRGIYANPRDFFVNRITPFCYDYWTPTRKRIPVCTHSKTFFCGWGTQKHEQGALRFLRSSIRYPHGSKVSNNRRIFCQAKKIPKKFAYVQFLLYLCSRKGLKHPKHI